MQNFTPSFSSVSLETYTYSAVCGTGEKVETEALLLDEMLCDIDVEKLIQYKFVIPLLLASMKGLGPNHQGEWFFNWEPVDMDWFFAANTAFQNELYNSKFLGDTSVILPPHKIEQIIKTSNDTFSKQIRKLINDGIIYNYPGAELLSDDIITGRFFISSVNYNFPKRVSYYLTFEKIDIYMLRFDIRINDDNKLFNLISINNSPYHNARFVKNTKLQEMVREYDLWR